MTIIITVLPEKKLSLKKVKYIAQDPLCGSVQNQGSDSRVLTPKCVRAHTISHSSPSRPQTLQGRGKVLKNQPSKECSSPHASEE